MEYLAIIELDTLVPAGRPRLIDGSIGVPVTGVVINGPLPAGGTLRIGRKSTNALFVLAGAAAAGEGGDALTDFFCPPQDLGMVFAWDTPTPGATVEVILLADGDAGGVTRV